MKQNRSSLSLFIIAMGLVGNFPISAQSMKIEEAICVLEATAGNQVTGTITFTPVADGMRITADLQGLEPGSHGIHIHEFGNCSAMDGTAAGGHFNPENHSHGAPMDIARHVGDLGNIEADASGSAHLDYVDKTISFEGNHNIIGRGLIVHKSLDDLKTQPTGNAGARVACGVIGVSKYQVEAAK